MTGTTKIMTYKDIMEAQGKCGIKEAIIATRKLKSDSTPPRGGTWETCKEQG